MKNIVRKIIKDIIIILLMCCVAISSFFIFKESKENIEQEKVFEELTKIVEHEDNEKGKKVKKKRNLEEVYRINNDFIGWLNIQDTTVNYPVMQTKNNANYYLRRNFYKEYSSYGTPYISEQCDIYKSDNLIIYGHNMRNKAMFGTLEKYKNKEYYNKHKIITFETLKKSTDYEIFSVFKTVAYANKGFKYYDFIDLQNEKEYNQFIEKCKELSFYETDKKPKYGHKLITLSTCEYSNKNGRLVVVAYEKDS